MLDERCPRWDVALRRAKPWRAKARDGSIYREESKEMAQRIADGKLDEAPRLQVGQ